MTDLIVFSVATNKYAVNIENVQRIVQATTLTNIPNSHEYIDGMMSYEDKVIKVVNFRKLIHLETFEEELLELFLSLKKGHVDWVSALKSSLETGVAFTKTLDPHACGLGKWIDSFTAYDDEVIDILNQLSEFHKQLHSTGAMALDVYKEDKEKALVVLNEDINSIYHNTMASLDKFINEFELVANSLQKFIIYDDEGALFAVKVDTIEDIAHIDDDSFVNKSEESESSDFLELEGVLDLDSTLINVIKTIELPK